MKNKRILYITQTAAMLALLIVMQFVTNTIPQPVGQFVTGSLVNLMLLLSVFLVGIGGGLAVAILSPFLAFVAGIGMAFIQIVPFIAVGNTVLVLIAGLVRKHMARSGKRDILLTAAGFITAGIAKTLFFWVGLVIIALPLIPGVNEKQIAVISSAFTWPQMVTALIGGSLAMIAAPLLKKAVKSL